MSPISNLVEAPFLFLGLTSEESNGATSGAARTPQPLPV